MGPLPFREPTSPRGNTIPDAPVIFPVVRAVSFLLFPLCLLALLSLPSVLLPSFFLPLFLFSSFTSSRSAHLPTSPQRQLFPCFPAVAEQFFQWHPCYRYCGAYCIFFLLSQRQQNPPFGAVVVPHFLLRPFHPSGRGVQFPAFPYSSRRCRVKRPIATTFSFSLLAELRQRPVSRAMPRFPLRKVPGEASFLHHLLVFVIAGPASETLVAGVASGPVPKLALRTSVGVTKRSRLP